MCSLIESILSDPEAVEKGADKSRLKQFIGLVFVFSLLWSVGGNLLDSSREKFEEFVQSRFAEDEDLRCVKLMTERLPGQDRD